MLHTDVDTINLRIFFLSFSFILYFFLPFFTSFGSTAFLFFFYSFVIYFDFVPMFPMHTREKEKNWSGETRKSEKNQVEEFQFETLGTIKHF